MSGAPYASIFDLETTTTTVVIVVVHEVTVYKKIGEYGGAATDAMMKSFRRI